MFLSSSGKQLTALYYLKGLLELQASGQEQVLWKQTTLTASRPTEEHNGSDTFQIHIVPCCIMYLGSHMQSLTAAHTSFQEKKKKKKVKKSLSSNNLANSFIPQTNCKDWTPDYL